MNQRPIRTIFDLVGYYGLTVEFLDLPAKNAGYLDPDDEPRYIALNRNLPHCEQVFTAAHELCHCISQHRKPRRNYRSRVLNHKGKSRRVQVFVRFQRRFVNRILPIEREANMFAMSWLVQMDPLTDLLKFLRRHPGKIWLCLFAATSSLIFKPFHCIKLALGRLLLPQPQS
jgi:hypothetical protein